MAYQDDEDRKKRFRDGWRAGLIFALVPGLGILLIAMNPVFDDTGVLVVFRKFAAVMVVLFLSIFIGQFFSPILAAWHISIIDSAAQKKQERNRERVQKQQQKDFVSQIKAYDKESTAQANADIITQSKQDLIMRLGTIDVYIRALETENDASKKTMTLQAIHSTITTIAANLATGKVSRDAIAEREVQEQAQETSNDLARIGLADDRLNRDIIRIFNLSKRKPK